MFSGEITAGPLDDHALLVLPYPNVRSCGSATVHDSNSHFVRNEIVRLCQLDTESMPWKEDPFRQDAISLEIATNSSSLIKKLQSKYVVDTTKLQYLSNLPELIVQKGYSFVIAKVNISRGQQIKAGFGVVYFKEEIFFPECYLPGFTLDANVQKFCGQSYDSVCHDMSPRVRGEKILDLRRRLQIQTYFLTGGSERLLLNSAYKISLYNSEETIAKIAIADELTAVSEPFHEFQGHVPAHADFACASTTRKQTVKAFCCNNPASENAHFKKEPSSVLPSSQFKVGTRLSCDVVMQNTDQVIMDNVLKLGIFYNPAGLHYSLSDFVVFCDICSNPVNMVIGWAKYDVCLQCAGNRAT